MYFNKHLKKEEGIMMSYIKTFIYTQINRIKCTYLYSTPKGKGDLTTWYKMQVKFRYVDHYPMHGLLCAYERRLISPSHCITLEIPIEMEHDEKCCILPLLCP